MNVKETAISIYAFWLRGLIDSLEAILLLKKLEKESDDREQKLIEKIMEKIYAMGDI